MRVSIAMATFNGARFLAEQLDSIAKQSHLPYELVVCDDGSTDRTLAMLNEFAITAPFPVRIYRNETNLGFADNFFKAASLCNGELIAFCDQDDVWMPKKLEIHTRPFVDSHIALSVHGWHVTDENLNLISEKQWKHRKPGLISPWLTINGFALMCSTSFFREFSWSWSTRPIDFTDLETGHRQMAHDEWLCLLAQSTGKIGFLPESLALYRQHTTNVAGAGSSDIRDVIQHALLAGQAKYAALTKLSLSYADYLDAVARRSGSRYQDTLASMAAHYRIVSEVNKRRANIYDHNKPVIKRFRDLILLASRGSYRIKACYGLSRRSFIKDCCIVGFSGLRGAVPV
jgi:glycosyltransferase involved in cell wall biosynthesis